MRVPLLGLELVHKRDRAKKCGHGVEETPALVSPTTVHMCVCACISECIFVSGVLQIGSRTLAHPDGNYFRPPPKQRLTSLLEESADQL